MAPDPPPKGGKETSGTDDVATTTTASSSEGQAENASAPTAKEGAKISPMQDSKGESKVISNAEETRGEEASVAPSGGAKVEEGMEKKKENEREVAHPEDGDKRHKRSSIKAVAHSIIELENMFEMGASTAFSFSAGSINRFADDVRHTGLRKQVSLSLSLHRRVCMKMYTIETLLTINLMSLFVCFLLAPNLSYI